MRFDESNAVQITCFPGLTPWLTRELEARGHAVTASHQTGVEISASLNDTMALNLHSYDPPGSRFTPAAGTEQVP